MQIQTCVYQFLKFNVQMFAPKSRAVNHLDDFISYIFVDLHCSMLTAAPTITKLSDFWRFKESEKCFTYLHLDSTHQFVQTLLFIASNETFLKSNNLTGNLTSNLTSNSMKNLNCHTFSLKIRLQIWLQI